VAAKVAAITAAEVKALNTAHTAAVTAKQQTDQLVVLL
jgi:hypothetical protein